MSEDHEVRYWTKALGVTKEQFAGGYTQGTQTLTHWMLVTMFLTDNANKPTGPRRQRPVDGQRRC
jgi:hypothetical protein